MMYKVAKNWYSRKRTYRSQTEMGRACSALAGKIDLIIAGMSPTEERKKEINFTNSYYTSEPVLVVKSDSKPPMLLNSLIFLELK